MSQVRSLQKSNEPYNVTVWLGKQASVLEDRNKKILDIYTENHPVGSWLRSIKGIGPVLAAGLIANIDIKQAPTAGHIWSYAGLDPTAKWLSSTEATKVVNQVVGKETKVDFEQLIEICKIANKDPLKIDKKLRVDDGPLKKKDVAKAICIRPWNASLKVICWKIGESFVKVSTNKDDIYGKLYKIRKAYEEDRNNSGGNKESAKRYLRAKDYGKDTETYKAYVEGKLPKAQIHNRATRYAVKIFLSHLQHAWYYYEFEENPPKPFAIAHLGHAHMLEVPNMNLIHEAVANKKKN